VNSLLKESVFRRSGDEFYIWHQEGHLTRQKVRYNHFLRFKSYLAHLATATCILMAVCQMNLGLLVVAEQVCATMHV